MRFGRFLRFLSLSAVLVYCFPLATQGRSVRERMTIQYLAQALKRMGEDQLARRLTEDYVRGRVHFGPVDDGNGETGRVSDGHNEVTFTQDMLLGLADQDRLLKAKPYSPTSQLIMWAVTVVHEYQHMDQEDPQGAPRWEDPAWQGTDRTVATWVRRLNDEFEGLRKQPSSKERDARMDEVRAIAQRLLAEIGSLREGVGSDIKNGSLSPGQHWLFDDSERKIRALFKTMDERKAIGQLATPASPSKVQQEGYWELVRTDVFDKLAPSDVNYTLSAGSGSITCAWRMNQDSFRFTATWTPPPHQIHPGDRVPIDVAVKLDQNAGDQYSANGTFSLWFDQPDCEPGSVIRPIGLKGEHGESPAMALSHRLGSPVPPAVRVYLEGKPLPTGTKGARIALLAAAYNGRNAGIRYIYEWKTPW